MDAFANSELKSDTPKKGLSEDEALCRFGGASSLRAEACSRVKLKPKSGLDPSGKIDRGEFERCKVRNEQAFLRLVVPVPSSHFAQTKCTILTDRRLFVASQKDYVMKDGKWSPSWSCTSS
jgi:hypothetical protein